MFLQSDLFPYESSVTRTAHPQLKREKFDVVGLKDRMTNPIILVGKSELKLQEGREETANVLNLRNIFMH